MSAAAWRLIRTATALGYHGSYYQASYDWKQFFHNNILYLNILCFLRILAQKCCNHAIQCIIFVFSIFFMNLFIGNLNPETTEQSLEKIFSEFGEIVSVKVIRDNETGLSKGFGFVEMADKFHAYDAIDNIDMTYFEGQVISVKEAKAKTGGAPQRGGGNRFGNNRGGGGNRFGGGDRYNNNDRGGDRYSGGGNRPGGGQRFTGGGSRPQGSGGHRDPFNTSGPRRNDANDDDRFNRL